MIAHTVGADIVAVTWVWDEASADGIKVLRIGSRGTTTSALPLPGNDSAPYFGIIGATIATVADYDTLVSVGWQSTIHAWNLDRRTHSSGFQCQRTAERSLNTVACTALAGRQYFLCGGFQCALVAWHPHTNHYPEITIGAPIPGIQPVSEREVLVAGPRSLMPVSFDDSFVDG